MQTMNRTGIATGIRILLGMLFLSTGMMKVAVPHLRAAFSGQLIAADIPFHSLSMWVVPAAEIGLGAFFILAFLPRLVSLFAIALMAVATYVHVTVNDPALFPLQPLQPIIPIAVMVLSLALLWIRSGSWSFDLYGKPAYLKHSAGKSAVDQCTQSCTCGATSHDV